MIIYDNQVDLSRKDRSMIRTRYDIRINMISHVAGWDVCSLDDLFSTCFLGLICTVTQIGPAYTLTTAVEELDHLSDV